ncbi:MAG: hypothetical protein Q9205_001736 [Flavoplaca limonia]
MSSYRTSSQEEQISNNPSKSDSTDPASSSEPQSSMLPSEPTPVSRPTPRESDQTSVSLGDILDSQLLSDPSAQPLLNEPNGEAPLEVPPVGAATKNLASTSAELPEIITDPPEQGDVEQSDPQDEKKDPDTDDEEKNPDDETKSDDKQTSTTSEMSEVSTSTPSSLKPSPTSSSSSTSTSSCTSGITLSATSICNKPSLKGVVHRNVKATYIVPSLTGTRELPEYTPYPESAATFSSSVPTANTDISSSSDTWAAASSTSSAKNNMATQHHR